VIVLRSIAWRLAAIAAAVVCAAAGWAVLYSITWVAAQMPRLWAALLGAVQ
jgi:hypothetical protein